MSDIFREVDEALQQEKIANLWKKHGSTIITALIVLVISTAIGTYYKKWDAKRNGEETARLTTALQSDDPQTAINNVIQDTRKSHAALGQMTAANLLLQDNKKTEAAEIYKTVLENKKTPRNLRDLSRIFYVQNAEKPDSKVLEPLLSNEKSPWIWHARIEAAVLSAHQDNDYQKAIDYLQSFNDAPYIPFSLKQRAQALSHVYTLKLQNKTSETKAD